MKEIIFKNESFRIIGACFEVYNQMGCGFLENVYQECLALEFQEREIPFSAQQKLKIRYKNQLLKSVYLPDFICYQTIIVEIK